MAWIRFLLMVYVLLSLTGCVRGFGMLIQPKQFQTGSPTCSNAPATACEEGENK